MAREAAASGGRLLNPWRIAGWSLAAVIVLHPLVAMHFFEGVNWTAEDYVFATIMVGTVGLILELAVRTMRSSAYRGGVGLALAAAFLLTWINLAVGIIGSEDNPLNLLYFGVIGVAVAGSFLARFQPPGMARAMLATAVAQLSVPVIALLIGRPEIGSREALMGVIAVFILSGFFALLFLGSAWLFGRAAQQA